MDSLVTCDIWLTASSVLELEPHQLGVVSHPSLPQYRHCASDARLNTLGKGSVCFP